jgi:hypothetical protein
MNARIRQKLELFINNIQILKADRFLFGDKRRLAAFYLALYNKSINSEVIRNNHMMIASHEYDNFPDDAAQIATLLSIFDNSEDLFSRIVTVHKLMENAGFHRDSPYIGLAAYLIATGTDTGNFENAVTRAKDVYDRMGENEQSDNNSIIACESNYPYAALYGISKNDIKDGLEYTDQLFQWFKTALDERNQNFIPDVKELARTVLFNNMIDANRVVALRDTIRLSLKLSKFQFKMMFPLSAIGILAQLPGDINTIAHELNVTQHFLRKQKGFSQLSTPKRELFLTSAMIVSSAYLDEIKFNTGTTPANLVNLEGTIIETQFTHIFGITQEMYGNTLPDYVHTVQETSKLSRFLKIKKSILITIISIVALGVFWGGLQAVLFNILPDVLSITPLTVLSILCITIGSGVILSGIINKNLTKVPETKGDLRPITLGLFLILGAIVLYSMHFW